MTREEFIKILDKEDYSYEIEGDKIVVRYDGRVDLTQLTSLPSDVVFKNRGSADLESITSIPPGVEFSNGGGIYSMPLVGGWLHTWKGNIEGIDSKRLFNFMISKGLFEK